MAGMSSVCVTIHVIYIHGMLLKKSILAVKSTRTEALKEYS